MTMGMDWGRFGVVLGALFVFGFGYNLAVAWLERHGYDEGYTAILVVVGVLATLAGVAVICWRCAMICLAAFGASGFWMVVGSWWRYAQMRKRAQELARRGE